ncbi:MAG: serpin family protein [Candidatus Thermoplasmatota archaeon]|nr:serpin family protein [Candidatus Thermoplasmatota archaeon]
MLQRRVLIIVAILAVAIIVMASVISIAVLTGERKRADDTGSTPEGGLEITEANNRFGFDIFKEVWKEDENTFISPWSIFTALSMTYEGARETTAEEMEDVLYLPENASYRHSSFARVHNEINDMDGNCEIHTANAIWPQEGYPFLEEYIDLIETYYASSVENLDFKTDPDGSREIINDWVEEQTNDRIKDLLPPNSIDELTRMVLTNAIYFKGDWLSQFDPADTRDTPFYVNGNEEHDVPTMTFDGEVELNYYEDENLQALELPYSGEELSMLLLLPRENDGLNDLVNGLSIDLLDDVNDGLSEEKVSVNLPKFRLETDYDLVPPLSDLGMPDAFDGGADFSGMDGTGGLFISGVYHKAFVEVNEEGTEAAAATAVVMTLSMNGPRHIYFTADHPFLFIIQQRQTGNILFMGSLSDPR